MKTKFEKFFTRLALTAVVVLLSPINAMASSASEYLTSMTGAVAPTSIFDSIWKNGLSLLAVILLPITVIVVLVIVFVRQAKKGKNKVSSKKKK